MKTAAAFVWHLLPLLAVLGVCGWVAWHWLKRTTDPVDLVIRWIITFVTMGGLIAFAARARDEMSRAIAIVLSEGPRRAASAAAASPTDATAGQGGKKPKRARAS